MSEARTRGRPWATPFAPSGAGAHSSAQALDRLERLLYLIPRASGPSGASLSELAIELGVDPATLVADLQEVQDRDLYRDDGAVDLQITLGTDRVRVWSTHDLSRPPKLSPDEALALWIGLEIARVSGLRDEDPPGSLRERLRRHLIRRREGDQSERASREFALAGNPLGDGDVLSRLSRATTDRHVCVIDYLKPDAEQPESRHVEPFAVVHAEGSWYVLAYCRHAEDVRAFRVDRVLRVETEWDQFERPPDFDPADHLDVRGGRVLDVSAGVAARVAYSAAIARWIAEHEDGEWTENGAFVVGRWVTDASWLARHVLGHAGEAEVLEPPQLRAHVADVATQIVRADG